MTDVTGTEPESEAAESADGAPVDAAVEDEALVEEPPDPHALDGGHADLVARLEAELGDAVLEQEPRFGDPVVRIRRDSWRRAAEFAKASLELRLPLVHLRHRLAPGAPRG